MSEAKRVKIQQYRNLLIVGTSVLMLGGSLLYLLLHEEALPLTDSIKEFSSPLAQVDAESVWRERAQNKLKEQEKETEALKNEIAQLKNKDAEKTIETDPQFQALQKKQELLEASLKHMQEDKVETNPASVPNQGRIFSSHVGAVAPSEANNVEELPTGIDNNELQLESTSKTPSKNKDTYVPSGTFAEAIMLGAADASAGVQAGLNPSPMLFRVVADGTLPNQQKSHLKNCVVTAAVVGDISSERGQIRLERMSCTFPNGEIVEQSVDGTVFGLDAKNGVRGTPVWREGALLNRAAIAGTVSGLGAGFAQKYTTTSISPLGSTQSVSSQDILKHAASQGASNAMEKLADYNIKRAEQYHPVIQLSAGQAVDIVFLCGFFLDGRPHEPCARNSNKEASSGLFAAPTTASWTESPNHEAPVVTPTGLTLSQNDVRKIKNNLQALG